MRFAKNIGQTALVIALAATLTGCESINALLKSLQSGMAPANSASTTAPAAATATVATPGAAASTPAAAATAASAAKPAVPVVPPEPPVDPAALRAFDEANRALKNGHKEDAERGFKSILRSNPELGGPHAGLGVLYRNANKLPEAVAEFTHAIRLSPKQPLYYNQLGVTYRQLGQFEKAREAYEQAIALDAHYTNAILNLGILYDMYLGDGTRAFELFVRYLALMPNGDATVSKWVAELKNRKPIAQGTTPKEKT